MTQAAHAFESNTPTRTFDDQEATRAKVPLLVGLMGPSGGGKTYSALRIASGIQRVSGGDIFVIDTEAKRSLHYAETFRFRHVRFEPPFGPLDYLAAIEHCVKRGAGVVIVDSMSHEHEGPGGVLEQHEDEQQRLAREWKTSVDRTNMAAWAKPKAQRRRLINTVLQLSCNMVFCFRAKEKIKPAKGGGVQEQGWMPIAGEEFLYEMTMATLLLPGSNGVPTWKADRPGEQQMIKLPKQFRDVFCKQAPLDEDAGEAMARWASGGRLGASLFDELKDAIEASASMQDLEQVGPRLASVRESKLLPPEAYKALVHAYRVKREELEMNQAEAPVA